MSTRTDIVEYRIEDLRKGGSLYDLIYRLVKVGNVVPVLGSGFTCGIKTRRGSVPSAEELLKQMISLLSKYGSESLDKEDIADLANEKDLSATAMYCIELVENNKSAEADFKRYIKRNFTDTRDVPDEKRRFLECGWEYIYTLNYDDVIESVLDRHKPKYSIILPWSTLQEDFKEDYNCILKLHGDAKRYLQTGDINFIVLSKSQYSQLMNEECNQSLKNILAQDISSKSLLFIGCSLDDEYDILFSGAKNIERLGVSAGQDSIYVYYDEAANERLPRRIRSKLKEYNIKNILRLQPDDFPTFYDSLVRIVEEARETIAVDRLSDYTGIKYSYLSPVDADENIQYIFSDRKLISYHNKQVKYPSFYVHRELEKTICKKIIRYNSYICFVAGRRYSGKTYLLLGMAEQLQLKLRGSRDIYYISGAKLSDEIFEVIEDKNNCIVIFDSNVITPTQVRCFLLSRQDVLRSRGISVICAVNASDGETIRKLADESFIGHTDVYMLEETFNNKELTKFNEELDKLSIIRQKRKENFLDFAYRVDKSLLDSRGQFYYTNINILSANQLAMNKAMIALALISPLNTFDAVVLDIQDALSELCQRDDCAVQQDYLSLLEQSQYAHAGIKYYANSTYWVRRCLSRFAESASNYTYIADAIYSIIECYKIHYLNTEMKLRQLLYYDSISPFFNLSNIQDIFFFKSGKTGSLRLPEAIYERLKVLLTDDYQYYHQFAKCELRVSRNANFHMDKRRHALNHARQYIEKAIDIAEDSVGSPNIKYTLAHMNVTRSLIMVNYLRTAFDEDSLPAEELIETIRVFYEVQITQRPYLDDYFESGKVSNDDTVWFINLLFRRSSCSWDRYIENNELCRSQCDAILNKNVPDGVRIKRN